MTKLQYLSLMAVLFACSLFFIQSAFWFSIKESTITYKVESKHLSPDEYQERKLDSKWDYFFKTTFQLTYTRGAFPMVNTKKDVFEKKIE